MAEKQNNRNKKREQLKWEYLKRSDFYREFCEWQRRPGEAIPDKFQPVNGPVFDLNPIVHTFIKYGYIHEKSFDGWYIEYYGEDEYQGSSLSSVDDLSDGSPKNHYMYGLFTAIVDRFKRRSSGHREPTPLEMADCLWIVMREERGFNSYLKIKQIEFTTEEAKRLTDDVYKILMARVPRDRLRSEELEKYLTVYDMRKMGKSDNEIIKKIYKVNDRNHVTGKRSKDGKGDKELTDEINKYFKFAERLIYNSERDVYSDQSIFPGEYWK